MKFNLIFTALTWVLFGLHSAQAVEGEIGPIEFKKYYYFSPTQGEQALRVESFGRMELKIRISHHRLVMVEGPLPVDGSEIPLGKGPVIFQHFAKVGGSVEKTLNFKLDQPGLYRIVASPALPTAQRSERGLPQQDQAIRLQVKCVSNCHRRSVPASEVFAEYFRNGGHQLLIQNAQAELDRLIPSFYSAVFKKELSRIVETQDFKALDRFPVIPLSTYRKLRDEFSNLKMTSGGKKSKKDELDKSADKKDPVVSGRLEALLGSCEVARTQSVEIHPAFPGLRYGHFPNLAMTDCQSAHSISLAHILTALGANSRNVSEAKSWVSYLGEKYFAPVGLIEALLKNKHQIEMRQERTYANFLSMTVGGEADLLWPVWIDTGWVVKGKPLVIPSGHSQHVWKISGPTVNTTVSFFMGMFGAGFQSQTSTRPAWTGPRSDYSISTSVAMRTGSEAEDEGRQDSNSVNLILNTFKAAHHYLRLNRFERETVAKGLPSDGYGYVGICNDSDAFLEMSSRQTCGGYPLVRDARLNKNIGGSVAQVLNSLPDDAAKNGPTESDSLKRIYNMRPYEVDSSLWIDAQLKEQMEEIKKVLDLADGLF